MGDRVKAIINDVGNGRKEARCGLCGKLLFRIECNFEKNVDLSSQDVIIVARCTRSCCKADNKVLLIP